MQNELKTANTPFCRLFSLMLAFAMLAAILAVPAAAAARENITPIGAPAETKAQNSPIDADYSRVKVLISTAEGSYVKLDLGTAYALLDGSVIYGSLDAPVPVKVKASGGSVTMTRTDTDEVLAEGSEIRISRLIERYEAGYATLTYCKNTDTQGRMYLGDFLFKANSNKIVMINDVPMAYYLYGVIGYELSTNSFPEALKAQAIVAKTHAMYFYAGNSAYDYDVMDGYEKSLYQSYRGFKMSRITTMPFCFDVVGEALAFEGEIIPASYGHTNGGETCLPSQAHPGYTTYDRAHVVQLDDIELEYYTGSRETIHIDFGTEGESSRLRDFILGKVKDILGVDARSVVSIEDILAFEPLEGTQRNMQKLRVKAKIEHMEKVDPTPEPTAEPTAEPTDGPAAKADPIYTLVTDTYTFECDIKELRNYELTDIDGSGDDYSSSNTVYEKNYKLYWGRPEGDGYTLLHTRYGNGVGFSQMGALARANPETYAMDYKGILDFYFPKYDLINITEEAPGVNEPTLPPLDPIIAYGTCCNDGAEYRMGGSTGYPVMDYVGIGEHIDVLGLDSGGYVKARWNGKIGYMKIDNVYVYSFPSPVDGVFMLQDGVNPSSANLRSQPSSRDGTVITKLPKNTHMTKWAQVGKWCFVTTENGYVGFISESVVEFGDPYEYVGQACLTVPDYSHVFNSRPIAQPGGRIIKLIRPDS